jgi:dTDP-4-amino-4,6-dideoxygalactose transaminase
MDIPFLDLVTPHREMEEDLVAVFREALRTAGFIGGPMVQGFEQDFARFCGTKHCIGVGSGTDALRFALIAAGVKSGEIVVTVPNTFIATTEAISQAGGFPDFVDIDEGTYNMDPEKLREYLETQCRPDQKTGKPIHRKSGRIISAVIPVHLYGQPANMDPINELAEKHRLLVIEDACQAHGAECLMYDETTVGAGLIPARTGWKKAGSLALAAAFSFYPGKNLGACGEAGAVTTNDDEIARTIRMLRDHGQSQKYHHEIEGYNGRLDAIMAGVLCVKLKRLEEWNARRRDCADRYNALLKDLEEVATPSEAPHARSVYHLYVIRTNNRDQLQRHLTENGIGTGLHYPVPLHLQNAYRCLGYELGAFPVAERIAKELLSLPMYPGLTKAQQLQVVETIRSGLAE